MNNDLVRLLREYRTEDEDHYSIEHPICDEAADAIEELQRDAMRYRWLCALVCNSLYITRDGDHACNYMSAAEWIDGHPEDFSDADPAEVERMKATGTIWRLQVYPNTPIGFNAWNGATLDAAIDAAIEESVSAGVL